MIGPISTSHLRADGRSVDIEVNERVEPTFRIKPILGRREQLCGEVNEIIRATGEIWVVHWKSTVEKEPQIQVSGLDRAEVSPIPE